MSAARSSAHVHERGVFEQRAAADFCTRGRRSKGSASISASAACGSIISSIAKPACSGGADENCPAVTYWMNSLQGIPHDTPLFVTLNPHRTPRDEHRREIYQHPLFDSAAISAQSQLWRLQGRRKTWWCRRRGSTISMSSPRT